MQVVYVPAALDERAGEWQGRVGVAARGGKDEGGFWHLGCLAVDGGSERRQRRGRLRPSDSNSSVPQ